MSVFGLFFLISLTSCTQKEWSIPIPELPKFTPLNKEREADWTSIRRANYAAADVMYQRASQHLPKYHEVELTHLNNLGEPIAGGIAPIAWLVPQQVGQRLAQLGLNVTQPKKASLHSADKRVDGTLPLQLTNNAYIKSPSTARKRGHIYVEGDYAYLDDELLISIRLVDGRTARILSSIEYDMDVDANTFMLVNPAQKDRMFSSGWMY